MNQNRDSAPKRLFGQVAIQRGFVTSVQVKTALDQQVKLREEGAKHKLIGMVLLEIGALGTTELIDVLKVLHVPQEHVSSL